MNLRGVLSNWELFAGSPAAVPRLRELILQLAVQGKLVPQDPKDEPASELLKKIKAEKERLVKEGKIKRDKPLAEVAEEEKPFELPVGWDWVQLGDVVEIVRGITFPANEKTKEKAPGRIACLRTANIQEQIEWDDLLFIADSFVGRDDQKLQLHDIVMSMANSRELVGKVALVDGIPHPEATFGGFLGVLRPWLIEPRYVMALLRTPYARLALIDSASQTTNIANVSLAKLRPFQFPLPPLAEQSRIVTRVQELMQLCDALEAKVTLEAQQHETLLRTLLATLTQSASSEDLAQNWQRVSQHFPLLLDRPQAIDALEQTILQLAVRGLLVPQNPKDEPASQLLKKICTEKDKLIQEGKIKRDKPLPPIAEDEQPFELPTGWEWVNAIDICSLITDGDHQAPPKADHGVPFLVIGDVRTGVVGLQTASRFVPRDYFESLDWGKKPVIGDVLYTTVGSFGIPVPVVDQNDFCFQRHIALFRLIRSEMQIFFALTLGSKFVYEQAEKGSTGIAQKTVPLSALRSLKIPLPPLPEQHRIVTRVTELRQLCAALRSRLAQSSQIQAQLAQALVSQAA